MAIIQLHPYHSQKVWGYEKWQFSTHTHGVTTLAQTAMRLDTFLQASLPIMIKYIAAQETLSIQVHPDDTYAREYTNDCGKTECWYITKAKPGATLICGLEPGCNAQKMAKAVENDELTNWLQTIPVEAGDLIYIPAGTVHAIMDGIELIEIQQSSDTTYRLYDWGRPRDLHLKEALAVIDYENKQGAQKIARADFEKLQTPFFTVEKLMLSNGEMKQFPQASALTHISGNGQCSEVMMKENETVYVEAGTVIHHQGTATYLVTTWE